MLITDFYYNSKLTNANLKKIFILATIVEVGVDVAFYNYFLKPQTVESFKLGGSLI